MASFLFWRSAAPAAVGAQRVHATHPAAIASAVVPRMSAPGLTALESGSRQSIGGRTAATLLSLCLLCAVTLVPTLAQAETPATIDMKLLVISADGTEPVLGGIQATLKQIGIPFDTLIATRSDTPFSARTLSDGQGAGRYQGIVLTTGNLGYQAASGQYESAFSAEQWQALWAYEAAFRVRQVTLYTYPGAVPDSYGLTPVAGVDTTTTPVTAQLSTAGKSVFSYLNTANPVTIRNAWTYLAVPTATANPVPLLSTPQGHAIASVYTYPDGRQNLALTADGNQNLVHTISLGYGIANWVSKGVFLGARKIYMNPQPDDILLDNDMWNPALQRESGTYRLTGSDFLRAAAWQTVFRRNHPKAADVTVEFPFNGSGATGIYRNDTLTPMVRLLESQFKWLSHTYTHANLDTISYAGAMDELNRNHQIAVNTLRLKSYTRDSMIQPDVSGLNNPEYLRAAFDFGIRYIVSDTSYAAWDNPSPNAGFYSTFQPGILIIPRRATNLYYNVSTPAEWVSEYNHFYAPGGLFPTWSRPLTYAEILDVESDMLLKYLLRAEADSLMFHQANMRAYDGLNSIMGDLLNAAVTKYEKLFSLPITGPSLHDSGVLMAARMKYDASGINATLRLGTGNTGNSIVLKTIKPVSAPLTGINYGSVKETYGGQTISTVSLSQNGSLTIPGPAW